MADESFSDFFARAAADKHLAPEARELATSLGTALKLGVIPSPAQVRRLRSMLVKIEGCGRLEWDGSCEWLRRSAPQFGLPQTPIGERALCQFRNNWSRCPGHQGTD